MQKYNHFILRNKQIQLHQIIVKLLFQYFNTSIAQSMDFGFDDGYVDQVVGIDMVDNGIMNVEEGMILTQMGYPGLGMAQMAMGQMQIAQGQNLIQVGMMENNMNMGYGMGYGGYGNGYGMGYQTGIIAEQALLIANQPYMCMGLGCTYACCVKRCPPNCMLSCCRKQVVIAQNQKPVVYVQQPNVVTQQVVYQNNNQGFNGMNGQQVQQFYGGPLYKQDILVWNYIPNTFVTSTHFANQQLHSMNKLKIKREIIHKDCAFLKTSHLNTLDHYYAVPKNQQLDWFCAIIYSKLQLYKYGCDLNAQYNGFIESRLPRKSLFMGEWAFRQILIDMEGLKSYRSRNSAPTTTMFRIPQLWTRFHLIQNHTHLVIKLHHEGMKYQYGIPLQNAIMWIRAFASLMR